MSNLIEKIGGIEKAREIVGGAPENTQMIIPCLDGVMYFSRRGDGKWFKWSDGYSQWLEYFGSTNPMDLAISLSDLRTAIAEHDHHWYGRSEEDELKAYGLLSQEKIEGGAWLRGDFSKARAVLEAAELAAEFKVGDLVCFKKCELPEFFGGVYAIEGWTIHGMVNDEVIITGGRRVHESVIRHATPYEITAGCRES